MNPIVLAYMPLFGLAVGSFLNLAIDRIPGGISIVHPPSRCDSCGRRLTPIDLIPLLSYLSLRGRCRFCGVRIPVRVFFVELVTGALFAVVAFRFGLDSASVVTLLFVSVFVAIFFIDLEHMIIPDKIVFPAIVVALGAAHFGPVGDGRSIGETSIRVVAGCGVGFGFLLFIFLASYYMYRGRVAFGFGDVKLGGLMGAVLGFPDIAIALYMAIIVGGLFAAALLLLRLKQRTEAIPYGPFLAGGAIAVLLVGKDAGWYVDLLS